MSRCRIIGVLLAVAASVSCGGDGYDSPTDPGPAAQTVTIEVRDNSFSPRTITINPGDTVRWVLRGATLDHNVTARTGSFAAHAFTTAGGTYEVRFTAANQTHDYSCATHADCCDMRGSIRVGESAPPYGY